MTERASPNLLAKQKARPGVRGVLRVLAYAGCVSVLSTVAAGWIARAEAKERLQHAGLELLSALGPRFVGEPQAVTLNDQRMYLSSKLVTENVKSVLDEFERHCTAGSPGRSGTPIGANPYTWLRSRLENPDGSEGHLACFVPNQSIDGMPALLERTLSFARSGDLAELGEVRYAVARRNSAAGATHVLAMWTEGSFNVRAMFAESGDAPGDDAQDLPRPPVARRVLSARLPGRPYSLRFYDSEATQAAVLESYARALGESRWHALALPVAAGAYDLNQNVRLFTRDGRAVIVTVSDTPAGKTSVSLLEMESTGFASAGAP